MQSPLQAPSAATDPKSVKVNLTTGTGVDIEWKDGHSSHYNFVYLRDACPCALCEDERAQAGRHPGEPAQLPPGTLPLVMRSPRRLSAGAMGKCAIKFKCSITHDPGSSCWKFLRAVCPCK